MAEQQILKRQNSLNKHPEGSFYIAWIVLTVICVPVAFVISLVILGVISNYVGDFIYVDGVQHITEDYLSLYVFFPIAGLITGLVQFGLLRSLLPRMGWWVLATTGGWLMACILAVSPTWLVQTILIPLNLILLLIGLATGLVQWLVLRKKLLGAGWWVVATLAGWGLLALFTRGNAFDQFGLIFMTLLPASTTALALRWLLSRAQPSINGQM